MLLTCFCYEGVGILWEYEAIQEENGKNIKVQILSTSCRKKPGSSADKILPRIKWKEYQSTNLYVSRVWAVQGKEPQKKGPFIFHCFHVELIIILIRCTYLHTNTIAINRNARTRFRPRGRRPRRAESEWALEKRKQQIARQLAGWTPTPRTPPKYR